MGAKDNVPKQKVPNVMKKEHAAVFAESLEFDEWLHRIETKLGISIKIPQSREQRFEMVAALCQRMELQKSDAVKSTKISQGKSLPSWREMALMGDACWNLFLKATFLERGCRNCEISKKLASSSRGFQTREALKLMGKKLELDRLLPSPLNKRHLGEIAEAFMGFSYFFAKKDEWWKLAQRYLDTLEGKFQALR